MDRDEERPEAAGSPEAVAAPTIEQLEAEVARYKREAEQNWQQFLHAAADLENYKKQAVRAQREAVERTRRTLLAVILSVLDNVERAQSYALQAAGEGAEGGDARSIVEGIEMTRRHVLDLLQNMGVRPFEAAGKPFDPRYHEAVETVPPGEDRPAGTVVKEIQRGYLIGADVLRPARVRVAQ